MCCKSSSSCLLLVWRATYFFRSTLGFDLGSMEGGSVGGGETHLENVDSFRVEDFIFVLCIQKFYIIFSKTVFKTCQVYK